MKSPGFEDSPSDVSTLQAVSWDVKIYNWSILFLIFLSSGLAILLNSSELERAEDIQFFNLRGYVYGI